MSKTTGKKILAIGKFEGVHLGHRQLLREVVDRGKAEGLCPAVMIFRPHPYVFFGDNNYKPLFTQEEQSALLYDTGINEIIYQNFDEKFAALSPMEFCEIIFADLLASVVIVGENYRFGKGRAGDVDFLCNVAARYGSRVEVVPLRAVNGEEISTSSIRQLLGQNFAEANRQLGFPFFILGIVKKGKQLGRTIGFPTLNIYPETEKFLPIDGVYYTNVKIGDKAFAGVTNIGLRPTVDSGDAVRTVETYMPCYNGEELYGAEITVEFLEFVRSEIKFGSIDELKVQIAKDVAGSNLQKSSSCRPIS